MLLIPGQTPPEQSQGLLGLGVPTKPMTPEEYRTALPQDWQGLWDHIYGTAQQTNTPGAARLAADTVNYYRQPERALSDYDRQGGGGNA